MAIKTFFELPQLDPITDDQTIISASLPPHTPGNSRYSTIETLTNYISSQVSTTLPELYSEGLYINYFSASVIEIKPGLMRSDDNAFNLSSSTSLFPDLTVAGVNGLDSGIEAGDTWYAVHVIGDSNGVNPIASLFSLSSTTPILPAGYDKFGFRGWVRNDSSLNILQFSDESSGRRVKQRYFNVGRTQTQIIVTGANTTYTLVDASAFVPPSAMLCELFVLFDNDGNNEHWYAFRAPAETTPADDEVMTITGFSAVTAEYYTRNLVTLDNSQQFEYRIFDNGAGVPNLAQVSVFGYEYTL